MQEHGKKITILIADDHAVVKEGLVAILDGQTDMAVVAQANSGKEAIDIFRKYRPEICLLDLRMPDIDGVQAIEAIRKDFPNARIIVLSSFSADNYVYRALQAGARGYLLKSGPKAELLDAVRAVYSGRRWITQEAAVKLSERIPHTDLTDREQEVLLWIARGLGNKQIADTLKITEHTVKYHVNLILSKLGADDRAHAVAVAVERGILILE